MTASSTCTSPRPKMNSLPIAKQDFKNARRITIDAAHGSNNQIKYKPALLSQGKNVVYALATNITIDSGVLFAYLFLLLFLGMFVFYYLQVVYLALPIILTNLLRH